MFGYKKSQFIFNQFQFFHNIRPMSILFLIFQPKIASTIQSTNRNRSKTFWRKSATFISTSKRRLLRRVETNSRSWRLRIWESARSRSQTTEDGIRSSVSSQRGSGLSQGWQKNSASKSKKKKIRQYFEALCQLKDYY